MNICHAFPFFSIRYAGGTSDLMCKIAKAQVKAGLEPVIFSGDYNFDYDLSSSLQGVEFQISRSYFDKRGFSLMPSLNKFLKRDIMNFDVVHMHVFRTYQNLILYKYCKKFKIPYIMDAHGSVPYATRKPVIKRLFDNVWGRKMLRDASWVVAETEVGINEYLEIEPDLNRSKMTILSPPFDTDEFKILPKKGEFRKTIGLSNEIPLIMFIGRVHHIKGNDFLIRGFAELIKKKPNAVLAIIGSDDGHMEECKKLSIELGIKEKVLFPGFLASADKNAALVDADIVAQMSRQEQGAWAPFEAVLCNTPIVTTDHTGAGEDVKKINAGATVRFDDTQDLCDTMLNILDNYSEAKDKTMLAKRYIENNLSFNSRIGEYTQLYMNS